MQKTKTKKKTDHLTPRQREVLQIIRGSVEKVKEQFK